MPYDEFVEALSPRPLAKRAYLRGLGHLLTRVEQMQNIAPSLARPLHLTAMLSALSSQVAPDPSTRPLQIRFPSG